MSIEKLIERYESDRDYYLTDKYNQLTCIQINQTQLDNIPSSWNKDDDDYYSLYCQILGIDDELLNNSIKFYPNPVSNILSIESEIIPIDKIEIYSILGKKIKEINSDFNYIKTDNLSEGIYIIRIYSERGTTVRKLIKK